ncbi:hypothetical protein Pelo_1976 [Pelomyxa schiedti]|nr:hypothetical protein Pelo_1976 [Pelomyxa schiedti]
MGAEASRTHSAEALAEGVGLTVENVKEIMGLWSKDEEMRLPKFKEFMEHVGAKFPNVPGVREENFAEVLFLLFDSDHNGRLHFKEFLGGLSILARGDRAEKATLLFHACDLDDDGKVTKPEFKKALAQSIGAAKTLMQGQVQMHLITQTGHSFGSGMLSRVLSTALSADTDEFIQLVFQADDNQDGFITLPEWLAHYQSNAGIQQWMSFVTGESVVTREKYTGIDTDHLIQLLAKQFPGLSHEAIQAMATAAKNS